MIKKKVAIIGTGTIGKKVAKELKNHLAKDYELVGMMKNKKKGIKKLEETFKIKVVTNLSNLLKLTPDFIVEAASGDVVKKYGEEILSKGIHFIPLSVGALADTDFYTLLQKRAKENNAVLYIPSGAIGGFDLMRKLTLADEPKVVINTYKSPNSLKDAPLFKEQNLSYNKKEIVFKGSAKEAINYFPQNINIAIATAIATIGPENVQTTIHSDPKIEANFHDIRITNKEGNANISFAAQPSDNQRTSSITAWSIISLLKNISDPIRFF